MKVKMSEGQSLSRAVIDVTCSPQKPAPKKLKCYSTSSSSKKKALPEQGNKVTAYFKPSPRAMAAYLNSTVDYPMFNTAPDDIGSFRYPMPLCTTVIKIIPYSKMTPSNVYDHEVEFSCDYRDDGNGIDPNTSCSGCCNPYKWCSERLWRKICLHRVCDYFDKRDFDGITKDGVYKVYYETFLLMVKCEVLMRCGYYELGENVILPDCMKSGSLVEAYDMMDFKEDLMYEYFTGRCVVDVQCHLDRLNGVFRGHCKEGDRIVDKLKDLI